MKIKASKIKPGMVINVKRLSNKRVINDYCLVTAVSGHIDVDYTHLDFNDSYNGLVIGNIKGTTEVEVIVGKKRKYIIDKIKDDVFRSLHDTENIVNTIRLIEAMYNR